ncbi:hypothetical protein FIV00_26065 [Labrenzia sp. THAF82]|nr:hypothetical protein FIV00_26065 [Labrenzia sp. THAF82]
MPYHIGLFCRRRFWLTKRHGVRREIVQCNQRSRWLEFPHPFQILRSEILGATRNCLFPICCDKRCLKDIVGDCSASTIRSRSFIPEKRDVMCQIGHRHSVGAVPQIRQRISVCLNNRAGHGFRKISKSSGLPTGENCTRSPHHELWRVAVGLMQCIGP